MKDFVSVAGTVCWHWSPRFRLVFVACSIFIPYGFPWIGLAWVGLAFGAALWKRIGSDSLDLPGSS